MNPGKYDANTPRVHIAQASAKAIVEGVLLSRDCPQDIATEVTAHLIDSDMSGVESHGVWRILQYADYYDSGYLRAQSRPSIERNDGGAIVTAGGAKGYALSVAAEMIAEAMLGPATTECNWLMLALNCSLYQEPTRLQGIAEDILQEFRSCPPAPGFEKVEIPGEREADARIRNRDKPISLPAATWAKIKELAAASGVAVTDG